MNAYAVYGYNHSNVCILCQNMQPDTLKQYNAARLGHSQSTDILQETIVQSVVYGLPGHIPIVNLDLSKGSADDTTSSNTRRCMQ